MRFYRTEKKREKKRKTEKKRKEKERKKEKQRRIRFANFDGFNGDQNQYKIEPSEEIRLKQLNFQFTNLRNLHAAFNARALPFFIDDKLSFCVQHEAIIEFK